MPTSTESGRLLAPIGIIGAGPVGLALALRLADFGVQSVILEAGDDLVPRGSKACLIHGDVLEILDRSGCGTPISSEGVAWRVGHTYVRGREIRRTEYPERMGFCEFVNISQYRIEQILRAAVDASEHAQIEWSTRCVGVQRNERGVSLQVETLESKTVRDFRYVVACDGVRSTVRDLTGVKWVGYSHKDRFLITDIRADLPISKERHFHYDPPFNPGRQLVMHPQPDDVWRIDWQLAPGTDIEAERADGRLDQRIRAVIGDRPYDIRWMSTYRFHQRVVEQFRVGDIFFAGDAAHALPPYGSRGMNSGIQDADNLAWKLAAVLGGDAAEDLLDSYHHERAAAAQENLRITEATIRFMVPPNRIVAAYRNLVLRLSRFSAAMRDRVNSGRMTEPFRYAPSKIIADSGSAVVGEFAPDMHVTMRGNRIRLRSLFGAGFVLLYVGREAAPSTTFLTQARQLAVSGTQVIAVTPAGEVLPESTRGLTIVQADGSFPQSLMSEFDLWVIRPDGHVAGAYISTSIVDLAAVVRRAAGAINHPSAVAEAPAYA